MNLMEKTLIPLLDRCITRKDIKEESGFIGMYTGDINRPALDNHVFLVYSLDVDPKIKGDRAVRFYNCTNLANTKVAYISGTPVIIYGFTRSSISMKNILSGFKPIGCEDKSRILTFWNGEDADVYKWLLGFETTQIDIYRNSIPEFDYTPGPIIGV